jgi:hypothetical protein
MAFGITSTRLGLRQWALINKFLKYIDMVMILSQRLNTHFSSLLAILFNNNGRERSITEASLTSSIKGTPCSLHNKEQAIPKREYRS